MNESLLEVLQSQKEKKELSVLMQCNEKTESFGLSLTEEDAHELVLCRNASLKKYRRVEFGEGILDKLIFTFCDSQYINQRINGRSWRSCRIFSIPLRMKRWIC